MKTSRGDEETREARRDLLDRARRLETVAGLLFRDALQARPDELRGIEREVALMEGRSGGDGE